MRSKEPEQFDDPVLKSAVKKAYANQGAPEALRQRVASLMKAADGDSRSRRTFAEWRRSPLYKLAAAAIFLLAVGVLVVQYTGLLNSGSSQNVLPMTIADAMVASHDACAKLPDHQLINAGKDLPSIRAAMKDQLSRPVLVADLGDGWSFEGAGVCMVGKKRAGHLLFKRGEQTVSIFSMPPVGYAPKGSGNYELTVSGHAIAGFATGRGLFCLVGHDPAGNLTLQDVADLRDKIRDQVALAPSPDSGACRTFHLPT